jgi:two-component system, sensor histidine kinase
MARRDIPVHAPPTTARPLRPRTGRRGGPDSRNPLACHPALQLQAASAREEHRAGTGAHSQTEDIGTRMGDSTDDRVLVLAPGRDADLTCQILGRAGLACVPVSGVEALAGEIARGVGAVVCAEEALSDSAVGPFARALTSQPPWSDLPVLVVAAAGDHGNRLAGLSVLGNVSVLSRPMALDTLVTAVKAALRARRRQYEVRDLLREREEAARRKDDFLTMLAHELRNPLAPVRYGVGVLRKECAALNETADRVVRLVDRQVGHMGRLIDDLLDVSRITRGAVVLKTELVDLGRIAREVVEDRTGAAGEKGLTVTFSGPDRPVWVTGDDTRLTQVVDNLLDNAQKFSRDGGSVHVTVGAEDGRAVVRVEDDGIGIDPGILPYLFEASPRVTGRSTGAKGGSASGCPW